MRVDVSDSSSPYSPMRQSAVIGVLAFAGMSAAFMQTLLIPIQGELPRLLDAEPVNTAWVITVTLLSAAVSTPIAGRLGDMFGKRRVAIALMAVLLVGSVICAISPELVTLIAGRALQGIGMGVIPLGISLLRDIVAPKRLGTAIALVSATLGVGGAIGLPISALVTENLDWHMLFVLSAGLAVVALALIVLVVPKVNVRAGGRVDVVGAIGLAIGLVGILLAVSQGNAWGWNSVSTIASLGTGIVVFALWGWYELRVTNPLVDLRVSVRPAVLVTNLASVAMGFALFASNVAFPQLLQLPVEMGGLGMGLLDASLMLMPAGLAMLAMSPIAGRVERTLGARPLLIGGAAIIAGAYLASVLLPLEVWTIGIINCVIGVGIGLGYAAMPVLIMGAVPRTETGAANGLNTLMRSFGTTMASAVVGAVLAQSAGGDQADSFATIFMLGLIAATLCAVLAGFIPTRRAHDASVAAGVTGK